MQITQTKTGREKVYHIVYEQFSETLKGVDSADKKIGNYLLVINLLGAISLFIFTKIKDALSLFFSGNTFLSYMNEFLILFVTILFFTMIAFCLLGLKQRTFLGWPKLDLYHKLLIAKEELFWKYLYIHFIAVTNSNQIKVRKKKYYIGVIEILFLFLAGALLLLILLNFHLLINAKTGA